MIRALATPAAVVLSLAALCSLTSRAVADQPAAAYIFPAGAQRGTTVKVRVGGIYLRERCGFEMLGQGVTAPAQLERTKTIWFEGPVIPQPPSQAQEDYPKDMAGEITLSADAVPGGRAWRVWTAQGATPARMFIVGDLPEVIEQEVDGAPLPVPVKLPVTINGRIFPREDTDVWTIDCTAGQSVTCTVLAASLGSPLDAQIEIRDPAGRRVAESSPSTGTDGMVRFVAATAGTYKIQIQDINAGGLQHYVYRLTATAGPYVDRVYPLGGRRGSNISLELAGQALPASTAVAIPADAPETWQTQVKVGNASSNPFRLAVDSLPEQLEVEPNDQPSPAKPVEVPVVLNGRIERPGDVDLWALNGVKGATLTAEVFASRLGSPLDAVLTVLDAQGKELSRNEDNGTVADPLVQFAVPTDGVYYLKLQDQSESRGGPAFAYRLRVAPTESNFKLKLAADAVTAERGAEGKLKLLVERPAGFADDIPLEISGLPAGVTVAGALIAKGRNDAEIVFKADKAAKVQAARLTIKGSAKLADRTLQTTATWTLPTAGGIVVDSALLAVAVPTPFKTKGVYGTKYAGRGGSLTKHYTIERAGFAGPLQVSMGEKQARHLQGVTGPVIKLPVDATEFDYTVMLPPYMEVGRTSRSVVMLEGEVVDPDGTRHTVSYTSSNQNEQLVCLVDPGQLTIDSDRRSLRVSLGGSIEIPVQVGRGVGIKEAVKVELVLPEHMHGIEAAPLVVPADQQSAKLTVKFAQDAGPFNMPLLLRATAVRDSNPAVAETTVEIVP